MYSACLASNLIRLSDMRNVLIFIYLESYCIKLDGLADKNLIRNKQIKLSSNEEAVENIRPGNDGWRPAQGDSQPRVIISVGNALRYGASIHLPKAVNIKTWDVILSGEEKAPAFRVS